jgi:transposase-like protein
METLCVCGRLAGTPVPHCPNCGSTYVVGKRSAGRIVMQGSVVTDRLEGFRCRKCSTDFSQGDECRAPEAPKKELRAARDKAKATQRQVAEILEAVQKRGYVLNLDSPDKEKWELDEETRKRSEAARRGWEAKGDPNELPERKSPVDTEPFDPKI